MSDEAQFIEAVNKIPDEVIQAAGNSNPKEIAKEVYKNKNIEILNRVFKVISFWDQTGDGEEAKKVGREIGDIAEKLEIYSKSVLTPQEHAIVGSNFNSGYKNERPHTPVTIIDLEFCREKRKELYGKVDEERQKMKLEGYPHNFGCNVKKRVKELDGSQYDPIALSVERLNENGETVADPIILDPGFVDVEIEKKGSDNKVILPYGRDPIKVVSGEVLYKQLVEKNGFRVAGNLTPLKHSMNEEKLRAWGFQDYKLDGNKHYVGIVSLDKPVVLGYASVDGRCQLVNLPGISLEGAKPYVPVLKGK